MASRRTPDPSRTSKPAVAKPAKASSVDTPRPAVAPQAAPEPPKRVAKPKAPATIAAPAKAHVSEETRRAMIAESAYLRAERRGFAPGGELEDWMAAEREVDALLNANTGSGRQ
jgi:Protein of unknown function (DUF2934)